MTIESPSPALHPLLRIFKRKNVLAGLMFIGIAAFGLWASRHYPVGTALRMSTGYVPRLLCWILMGLGAIVLWQGLREADAPDPAAAPDAPPEPDEFTKLRPVVVVAASLVAFGLALETLGLMLSIVLMVAIASFATRDLRARETLVAAAALCVLTWAIFIAGLGLPIPVWPDW